MPDPERSHLIQGAEGPAPVMDTPPEQNVRRRKVFYISGFDPKGPAYYHALYAEEARKQASLNGLSLQVGEAHRKGRFATVWTIDGLDQDGASVATNYEVLRWDDIMRSRMSRRGPVFYWKTAQTYWLYLRTGTLWKILKASYPAFLAGLYPVAFLISFLALATLAAAFVFGLLPDSINFGRTQWPLPLPVKVATAGFAFAGILWCAGRLENKIPFFWPLHVYAFAADHMRGRVPEMDERVELFAQEIADHVARSNEDEVLIASHSNGTVIAAMALAAAFRIDPDLARHGPSLSFLTLGQSIPLCSFLPQAKSLRRDLSEIASDNGMAWVDLTAPRDAACFALTDPLKLAGSVAEEQNPEKPKLLSVPLGELFSPETFRKTLRHRWLRIHFQYLMATERATPYDYFLISAGPLCLDRRFSAFPSKNGFPKFQLFGGPATTQSPHS